MKSLRKRIFAQKFKLDDTLLSILKGVSGYEFLTNLASLNIYTYLVRYVVEFAKQELKKSDEDLRVLDWGTGKGHVSYLLDKEGVNLVSCDRYDDSDDSTFGQEVPIIKHMKLKVVPLNDDVELPFKNESFDVILSFGVLEHVKDDIGSLREINRILRPGGLFFCFNLPYKFSWTQNLTRLMGNTYHDRLYTLSWVKKHLPENGFKLLDGWHRQLFPKNKFPFKNYYLWEKVDQFLVDKTVLKYLATNIEFVCKKDGH